MNKPYRFMTEYATFQIKSLMANKLMNDGIRIETIRRLCHAMSLFERGMITVDETMRLLSMPDTGEDMSKYAS